MTRRDDVPAAEDRFFAADFVLIDVMTGSEIPGSVLADLVGARQLVFDSVERIDSRVRTYGSAAGPAA
jgi:hypothetical protein